MIYTKTGMAKSIYFLYKWILKDHYHVVECKNGASIAPCYYNRFLIILSQKSSFVTRQSILRPDD